MNRIAKPWFPCVWIALASAAAAHAQTPATPDVLVFTNGDRLSGKLLRGVKDSIVFHTDLVGDITVPLAKVRLLQTSGSFAVLQKGVPVSVSQQVQPEPLSLSESAVIPQPPNAPPLPPIPVAQVAYIVDAGTFERDLRHRAGVLQGWAGTVTAGATAIRSTQYGASFTTAASFTRQVPLLTYLRARNKTIFNVQETYGTLTTPVIPQTVPPSPDSVVKSNVFHADAERDEYFSPRAYVLADGAFDHNFAQGLQLQQAYGAGLGYTARATPTQNLELKFDVHYERQQFFTASQNLEIVGAALAETYRAAFPRKLVLTEAASVSPALNVPRAYSANAALGLAMPVLKQLSVSLNATDSFLNNPSPGYQKNSLPLTTGLTYTLSGR